MGKIKAIGEEKIRSRLEKVNYKFHKEWEDCDICINIALDILDDAYEYDEGIIDENLIFQIYIFIINVLTEKAIENNKDRNIALESEYYIKLARQYITCEYDKINLMWLESKMLTMSRPHLKDLILNQYNIIEKYYKNKIKNIETKDELVKQQQNLYTIKKEIASYLKLLNLNKAALDHIYNATIMCLNLYLEESVSLQEIKGTYNIFREIANFNENIGIIQRVDELFISNRIAL